MRDLSTKRVKLFPSIVAPEMAISEEKKKSFPYLSASQPAFFHHSYTFFFFSYIEDWRGLCLQLETESIQSFVKIY